MAIQHSSVFLYIEMSQAQIVEMGFEYRKLRKGKEFLYFANQHLCKRYHLSNDVIYLTCYNNMCQGRAQLKNDRIYEYVSEISING